MHGYYNLSINVLNALEYMVLTLTHTLEICCKNE